MALFQINYGSDVMNKYMGMNVILPDEDVGPRDRNGKYAVIYLLHGYTDDHTKWLRMTGIERYAMEMGLAVVMPDGGKSFYADMAHGDQYFTYITEEVPAYVQKWFPITSDPNHTYVAGLSMGGYGAMKIALSYPERFFAAASFSGSLAIGVMADEVLPEDSEPWLKRLDVDTALALGDVTKIADSVNDIFWLAREGKLKEKVLPELYLSCGTEDFIYNQTILFREHLRDLGIPFRYHEEAGEHEWGIWDREIRRFMEWIVGV